MSQGKVFEIGFLAANNRKYKYQREIKQQRCWCSVLFVLSRIIIAQTYVLHHLISSNFAFFRTCVSILAETLTSHILVTSH